MLDFGRSLGLETSKDPAGNVIIRKPASPGMENRKPVVLQSHLDMVHQKNADTDFDFETQGIQMYVDENWVRARGTTLGADNGMGVAAMMAILADTSIAHPPLEALFTVDEETGMTGAKGLEPGLLQGEILLNLDTEEDDEIDIGCAGGIDITATAAYDPQKPGPDVAAYTIRIKGLQGGHSGMDIHKGLGNANKIMNRLLYKSAGRSQLRVGEVHGGGLRNAIPRESTAHVTVPKAQQAAFEQQFANWKEEIGNELALTEPSLSISLVSAAAPASLMDEAAQENLLKALSAAHNGVYSMSAGMDDLVEASNNIARVSVAEGRIHIGCLTRSSVDTVKDALAHALSSVFELAGFEVEFSGEYPGWSPNPDSAILKLLRGRYQALFGKAPRVVACHAGLECGILGAAYPAMDMISFGPTIRGAHSPDERVEVGSVLKFWKLLLDVLANIPQKETGGS